MHVHGQMKLEEHQSTHQRHIERKRYGSEDMRVAIRIELHDFTAISSGDGF